MGIGFLEIIVVVGAHALDSASSIKLGPNDLVGLDELVEFPVESIILVVEHGRVFLQSFLLGQLVDVGASQSALLTSGSFQVSSHSVGLLFSFPQPSFQVPGLSAKVSSLGLLELHLLPEFEVVGRLPVDIGSEQVVVSVQSVVVVLYSVEFSLSVLQEHLFVPELVVAAIDQFLQVVHTGLASGKIIIESLDTLSAISLLLHFLVVLVLQPGDLSPVIRSLALESLDFSLQSGSSVS